MGGYWSYLGTDVKMIAGGPTMNLQGFTGRTPIAEYRRVVTHEFGHTLGFPHEHMRTELVARLDREKTVRYFAQTQGWSRRDVETQVLTPLDETSVMGTPADQTSIMCYQLPGSITIDGRPIPGGDAVNVTDLSFADIIYPLPVGPGPPPLPPPVEPEPPKPPDPGPKPEPKVEESGPYALEMGRVSDVFTMLPASVIVFKFTLKRKRSVVATTRGDVPLTLILTDEHHEVLAVDDHSSGVGVNAMLAVTLPKGAYYLKVAGLTSRERGPFRVKVGSVT
jgi:hypothetical protein